MPRKTAPASVITSRSEPVNSAIPAPVPASDPDQMVDITAAGSHSPHPVSFLPVYSGGAIAENESGGTGGGGCSSSGAGLPDSADVGRGPELPVHFAAIMAQLTALSKQMEAIQQQQTKMEAIQQQQTKMEAIQQEQTSDNLARSGVSGIYKPHTPAEKGAASDKALSVEEFLTKYGVRRFSESSLACEVCRRHWARPGGSQASQVNATSEKACGYFLQPLGSSGVPHLRQSVSRHQNAVGHKKGQSKRRPAPTPSGSRVQAG
jgi:hypothetical protein